MIEIVHCWPMLLELQAIFPRPLASVTWIAAVVASVDLTCWPLLLGMRNRAMTCSVRTKVNLVSWHRHVSAARCCIMHFMVAVVLGVLVDNEPWHLHPFVVGRPDRAMVKAWRCGTIPCLRIGHVMTAKCSVLRGPPPAGRPGLPYFPFHGSARRCRRRSD